MSNSKHVLGIFVFILVLFLVFIIFSFTVLKQMKVSTDGPSHFMSKAMDSSPIAVVEIEGPIMESKKILERLFEAEEESGVKAIILRIDSPGGAVGPTQEIYEEVVRIDKKIPVYASFGSMAASGGYYIGSATRKIFASAGTLTGSIGVIMSFLDLSKVYEWAKVSQVNMKAGKYKDIGSQNRPMTDEEKELMNAVLSKVHEQFRRDILKRRSNRIKGDFTAMSQGQIFSGEEALENGLVDELAGLNEAGRRIHKELKLKGNFEGFNYIEEKKKFDFQEFLGSLEEGASSLKQLLSMASTPVIQ
jgi:protease-4